ncbi:MAG: type II toxin-antitoxin system HicB family antitoxin [Firmicutes bacterium]|nr:type II toxin-antitoxin system HicB family antitoxin [Bacillota bacterium]
MTRRYYVATVFNETTKEFNLWIPDLMIMTRAESLDKLKVQGTEMLERYFKLVIEYKAQVPKPSPVEELSLKFPESDGFTISYIDIE